MSVIIAGWTYLPAFLHGWLLPRALRLPALSSLVDEGRGLLGLAYIGN